MKTLMTMCHTCGCGCNKKCEGDCGCNNKQCATCNNHEYDDEE